jgi:hypothetical protein
MPINIDEGGTGISARFERGGDRHGGVILDAEMRQARDFDTGQPKTWPDGNPVMQYVITIREDDEDVTLYARGGNYSAVKGKGQSMKDAIDTAVRAAGTGIIEAGAEIEVVYSGLGEVTKKGMNAPKLYTATYKPPPKGFKLEDEGGGSFGNSSSDDGFSEDDEPF